MADQCRERVAGPSEVCVLWRPRDDRPDTELLDVLSRKTIEVVDCANQYQAVAQICRLYRDTFGPRSDRGGKPVIILLLDDPRRLAHPAAVIGTIGRYAPGTALWAFDRQARSLTAVIADHVASWAAIAAGAESVTPAPAEPKLRLAGQVVLPGAAIPKPGASPTLQSTFPIPSPRVGSAVPLTDEELRMLLASDPEPRTEQAPGGGR